MSSDDLHSDFNISKLLRHDLIGPVLLRGGPGIHPALGLSSLHRRIHNRERLEGNRYRRHRLEEVETERRPLLLGTEP